VQSFPSFGIYQATALLGRGGMGSVYLANRTDGVFTQQVAIKVLAQHLAGEDFEARFIVERQLLAQMQHPNIVRLLDGGISASGEPYLVTEFVDGVSLDQYCDQKQLPIPQRIRLFLEVCSAVEHAHQNLVVHRDLKPSNILVSTKEGHLKLLDFGTAKLLKGPEESTVTEAMLLTPRYASPEQLRKDPITTRSDVYSLGMVLYELLSGQRPFGNTGEVVQELARAYQYSEGKALGQTVTGEDAAKRSTSESDLKRTLSGDLALICSKALDHDPARRYATARELASDLEAYLASKPISARPATALYRTQKYLRRNWPYVTAAALVLIAATAGLYSTLKEKRLAERRFEDVRRLAHYQIFDLYDQLQDVQGTTRLRAGMSTEALRYLDALAAESSTDESLAVEVALGYLRVGDVTGNFGAPTLGNWREALSAYQKGLAAIGKFQSYPARRTRTWLNYGQISSQLALQVSPESAKVLAPIVYDFEVLAREAPKDPENHLRLGKLYQAVARALQTRQFKNQSEDWIVKAKASFEKGLDLKPDSRPLLVALYQLAAERTNWASEGQPQLAVRYSDEAEMWLTRMPQSLRNTPLVKRYRATSLSAKAATLTALGQRAEALNEMNAAADIFDSLSTDSSNLAAQMDLISVTQNKSSLEYDLGLKAEYTRSTERSIVLIEKLLAAGENPRAEELRLRALYNLSYAYSELKDPRADELLTKTFAALEQRSKNLPKDVMSRVGRADLLLNLRHKGFDQPEKALPIARELTEIAPGELNSWELLAESHLQLKQVMEAIGALEKGLACLPAPRPGEQPSEIYQRITKRIADYRSKLK
jgi:non-specific serine/threonine protein kinase/serine/threonine-protein kinase